MIGSPCEAVENIPLALTVSSHGIGCRRFDKYSFNTTARILIPYAGGLAATCTEIAEHFGALLALPGTVFRGVSKWASQIVPSLFILAGVALISFLSC